MGRATRPLQLSLGIFLILGSAFVCATACRAKVMGADHVDTLIPNGWKVESTTQGDLTGNGIADKVLVLLSKTTQADPDGGDPVHPRILLVLVRTKSGAYKRLASSRNLLLCQECFGVLGGGPEVSVTKKHVLIVDQMAGSRFTSQGIWRFRIDHGTGKLRLIGLDVWQRDRGMGSSTLTSTNYLTGKQIQSSYRYDAKKNKDVLVGTKARHVPKSKTYLGQASSKSMDDE